MKRCDFASVMAVLQGGLIAGNYENAVELIEALFTDYQDEYEKYMDRNQVNKWLKGTLKLSADIVSFYGNSPAHQRLLTETVADVFLPVMVDREMTVQSLQDLLEGDPSVSEAKKRQLCLLRDNGDAVFVTAVLVFSMQRPFAAPERDGARTRLGDRVIDDGLTKPCPAFCGRETELEQLHELLQDNDKVFLQGIPGIGKSELARAYAQRYRKEYTDILFLPYTGSLHRDIAELEFFDDRPDCDEDELFRQHNRFLRTLREDTLIIIDNFNTAPEQEELLSVVLKYRCRVLFTTKSVFAGKVCMDLREISDRETLFRLAAVYFPEAEAHRPVVEDILRTVHYHTLSSELAARLLDRGILPPEELLEKLRTEHAGFDGPDRVTIDKDGQTTRATYYEHLRTLVALFRLDDTQCRVMRCMAMIPLSGIDARLFARWTALPDLNAVEELTTLGFISRREATIYLDGEKVKVNLFCARPCHSCAPFVAAYWRQNLESFLDAIIRAFRYFGGVPQRIIFDNARVAVKSGFGAHAAAQDDYARLSAHYGFQPVFCNPASGSCAVSRKFKPDENQFPTRKAPPSCVPGRDYHPMKMTEGKALSFGQSNHFGVLTLPPHQALAARQARSPRRGQPLRAVRQSVQASRL